MTLYSRYYIKNKGSKFHAFRSWLIDRMLLFMQAKPVNIEPKKILIVDNGHIGDLVMTTSVFREIKKNYPSTEITALVSRIAKPILEKNKNVDKIISMDFFWRKGKRNLKTFFEYFKFLGKLRKEKYDLGVAIRSDLPNIFFLLYLANAKKRVAYYNLDGGKPFLTNPIRYEKEIHATNADLNLANFALNMKSKNNFPEIPTDKEDEKAVNEFLKKNNLKKFICIGPGSAAKLQTLDKNKFKRLIEWMKIKYPSYKVMLTGGSEDERLIDWLCEENKNCMKLINFNIRLLGLLFKRSACTILHDGGPMHIAYAMKTPKLIVLWGPNPLEHVMPLKYFKMIHHRLDCYPCMRREKECKKPEGKRCMDLITAEEIKKAIDGALK
jgi:heptosyltransferase-2